jgi:hypothetical protein
LTDSQPRATCYYVLLEMYYPMPGFNVLVGLKVGLL